MQRKTSGWHVRRIHRLANSCAAGVSRTISQSKQTQHLHLVIIIVVAGSRSIRVVLVVGIGRFGYQGSRRFLSSMGSALQ